MGNNAATTQNKFKRNIQRFKNREDVKVLLMPISRGANGLNLVEASHVILLEPLLNPAQELQAIGRVHRIGQKKKTYVHRFLVKQTIEERIHQMLKNYHQEHCEEEKGSHSTEENLLTIQDLRNLFVDDDSITFDKMQQDSSEINTEQGASETSASLGASESNLEQGPSETNAALELSETNASHEASETTSVAEESLENSAQQEVSGTREKSSV